MEIGKYGNERKCDKRRHRDAGSYTETCRVCVIERGRRKEDKHKGIEIYQVTVKVEGLKESDKRKA